MIKNLSYKKVTALFLSLILLASTLVACGKPEDNSGEAVEKTDSNEVVEKTETGAGDWDKEVSVLVMGAGASGLSAAVEAADNGAESVLLIEKMPIIGGTTFASQGLIAGYQTEIAKRLGINHTEEELYELLMSNASYRLDPDLTRITVAKSGETIDWLDETIGIDFVEEVAVGYGPYNMMHAVEGGGVGMKDPFMNSLEDRNVELMLETTGKEILVNEAGEVEGVIATDKDDNEIRIKAKSVVIATGGYAYNADLAKRLNPIYEGIHGIGYPSTTGDGVIMASNIGAGISNSNHLMAILKDYEILEYHNGGSASANVSGLVAGPNLIFVGQDGKRFMDEKNRGYMAQDLNEPILEQMHKDDSGFVWVVFDQANLDVTKAKRGKDMEFLKADTIEELALLMEVDPNNLKETVDNWNAMVAEGVDHEFGREELSPISEGSYYAVSVVPSHIITYGGILRNENAEVLRLDNTVIPGLYTAGEASSNSAYMGFTLTNAFTWGRIAGENAAKYSIDN